MIDLQNSFTAVKSSKFPIKSTLGYPPHLKYVAALPWKNKNQKFCTIRACKTCFRSDFLSSIQQISVKCHIINAKINNVQNINIFFCLFTVLNRLRALQLSKVGLWSDFSDRTLSTLQLTSEESISRHVFVQMLDILNTFCEKTCKRFAIFHVFLV